jgi:hypothetical protein
LGFFAFFQEFRILKNHFDNKNVLFRKQDMAREFWVPLLQYPSRAIQQYDISRADQRYDQARYHSLRGYASGEL